MRTTPARLGRIAVAALALGSAPAVADGAGCESSLTGTWSDDGSQRLRIVEGTDHAVSVFDYDVVPSARRHGITLEGGRSGDTVTAGASVGQIPFGLLMTVASCDTLEARWFTPHGGGSTSEPFVLQRRSSGYCGDGSIGPDEECDDGNFDDGDTCTDVCLLPRCGDAVRDAGEACDDGNPSDRDGCSATCRREYPRAPQPCPDLSGTWHVTNGTSTHGGPWTFRHTAGGALEVVVFSPWSTDLLASRVTLSGREHRGRIELVGTERFFERESEVRLEGSALSCDRLELQPSGANVDAAFPPLYVLERDTPAYCGDGVVDAGELCDDGNLQPGDGCSFACTLPVCGDGLVDPGEDCDPGELVLDRTCDHCRRDTASCADLTGTWRGAGTIYLGGERDVDDLYLSLVDDGHGNLRGAVAGDALGLRREIWLTLEGAHAGADLWLASSVRTTTPRAAPVYGLSDVLGGTLEGCESFRIWDATFSRVSTGVCGDGRRKGPEACDDGNTTSGDGCSASCTAEDTPRNGRPILPRRGAR